MTRYKATEHIIIDYVSGFGPGYSAFGNVLSFQNGPPRPSAARWCVPRAGTGKGDPGGIFPCAIEGADSWSVPLPRITHPYAPQLLTRPRGWGLPIFLGYPYAQIFFGFYRVLFALKIRSSAPP